MNKLKFIFVLVLLLGGFGVSHAFFNEKSVVFVFDNSGSMGDEGKLELAKNASYVALEQLSDSEIALLSFDSCYAKLSMNWTKDKEAIKSAIKNFTGEGSTPIAESLIKAYDLLEQRADKTKPGYVLLFTDGEETCLGNPCEVVKEYNGTSKIQIYTIGYAVDDKARSQLGCVANFSGGQYLEAPTPGEIETAMKKAVFLIEDQNKVWYIGLLIIILVICAIALYYFRKSGKKIKA